MGLFDKKSPMDKWRSKNKVSASFVDAQGWDVDLVSGVVHTTIDGTTVTVLLSAAGSTLGVIIEAGAQAERTLANSFGDDGGEAFEFEGWTGVAAPGSGLIDTHSKDGAELHDKIVAAAHDLVSRIN